MHPAAQRAGPGNAGTAGRPGWPRESRAAALREREAIRNALACVVGTGRAEALVAIADELLPEEPLPEPPSNAWTRAEALLETAEGRARLKALASWHATARGFCMKFAL